LKCRAPDQSRLGYEKAHDRETEKTQCFAVFGNAVTSPSKKVQIISLLLRLLLRRSNVAPTREQKTSFPEYQSPRMYGSRAMAFPSRKNTETL
jgi:hypothetical protein